MIHLSRIGVALATVTALAMTTTACTDTPDDEPTGPVTISVGNLPSAEQQQARTNFLKKVEAFQTANPDIKLDPVEIEFAKETFTAQLAGGTLPTVLSVPYTEPQALIARKQIADITAEFNAEPGMDQLNKSVLRVAQDEAGKIYGIPVWGYTIGLIYNRDLFTKAGLDPDAPPRTWDEVMQAAKTISEKTDAAGFAQMTQGGFGGWMFSALTYSFGGSMETPDGDRYQAAFNAQPAKDALAWLKTLRWDHNAMGSTFLYDQETLKKDFAAGKVGMYLDGADAYHSITTNFKLDPAHFGLSTLPQQGGTHGTLGGGSVAIVRPDASAAERAAAIKWVKFNALDKFFNKEGAELWASARVADGLPVGHAEFPLVSRTQFDTYREWIKPHINTPQENFVPYTSMTDEIPVLPEPPHKAQELYNALSAIVQAVLTRQDADIDKLLADAEVQANRLLSQG